jgi:hypothetical protein
VFSLSKSGRASLTSISATTTTANKSMFNQSQYRYASIAKGTASPTEIALNNLHDNAGSRRFVSVFEWMCDAFHFVSFRFSYSFQTIDRSFICCLFLFSIAQKSRSWYWIRKRKDFRSWTQRPESSLWRWYSTRFRRRTNAIFQES